ncbi:MAG TPA: ATP-binding protein [Streptosporangiaceae bacterium]
MHGSRVTMVTGGTARIEVSDDGPGIPQLREPGHDHGGYGLWLVDWLAQAWGISSRDSTGKTVWFTLPVSGA